MSLMSDMGTAVRNEILKRTYPTGAIAAFAMTTPPPGWLECNGSAISRTIYEDLFEAIGTTFGAGDGVTTFNLPDLRGEFVRGFDNGRGIDAGRAFGSSQADELKSHTHSNVSVNGSSADNGDPGNYLLTAATQFNALTNVGGGVGATGGSETRPRNIALKYCIKAYGEILNEGVLDIVKVLDYAGIMATLRLTTGTENNQAIELLGYYTAGDGGGGTFYWDATSTETDNGGTIIQATGVTTGRWKRVFSGAVNVKWFGVKGDTITNDHSALQTAIDFVSDRQGSLFFPRGTYSFDSDIFINKNTNIYGEGKHFSSCLNPRESASFQINGDNVVGGWAFRIKIDNILVYANNTTATKIINIKKAYQVETNVYLHNIGISNGIYVEASNSVIINKPNIFGAGNSFGTGILIDSSDVTIVSPDIEVLNVGIQSQNNSVVTILHPYMERNITSIKAMGNNKHLTIVGGKIVNPSASATLMTISSPASIFGGSYTLSGGNGIVIDSGVVIDNLVLQGIDETIISDARKQAVTTKTSLDGFRETQEIKFMTLSDNVATTIHSINMPFVSNEAGFLIVELNARDNSGYSLWTANYKCAFTNPDNTIRVTPVTEYGKSNVNISANYGLAITCSIATAANTVNFQVTANTSGAIGEGQTCQIQTKATLVTKQEDTLNIYFK